MAKSLNIGMIGYGYMGRAHTNAYRKVNNFFDLEYRPVLKAVCARDAAKAKAFADQGFKWLHCVDLNGAFAGHSANVEAIKSIRATTPCPIQLGGGIRDMAAVEGWLAAGITRVILGTAALTNPTSNVPRLYRLTYDGANRTWTVGTPLDVRSGTSTYPSWSGATVAIAAQRAIADSFAILAFTWFSSCIGRRLRAPSPRVRPYECGSRRRPAG